MNEPQLKQLIKGIVKEMAHAGGSDYQLNDIEIDGQTIPKIITPEHILKFDITIEYEADSGYPARGMSGPPEHSSPAEGASVEIRKSYPTGLSILAPKGKNFVEVNLKRLKQKFPKIYESFAKIASAYVDTNSYEIEDEILDSLGDPSNWDE